MAVSRTLGAKHPTQQPKDFFECKQQGGPHGKPTAQPTMAKSGPMREHIMGKPQLNKAQTR